MSRTKMLLVVALVLAGIAMVARFWDTLMLFLLSGIIAYLFDPLTKKLVNKTRMPWGLAVGIVLIGVGGLVAAFFALLLPYAIDQFSGLLDEIRYYAANFDTLLAEAMDLLMSLGLPAPVTTALSDILAQSDGYIASFISSILSAIVNVSVRLFDSVIVIILVVYFMLDGHKLFRSFIGSLTPSLGRKVEEVMSKTNGVTWAYIKSTVLISLAMAAITYVGLVLIEINYAGVFAIMFFVLNFIPYFGSIIAGIVVAFFALITQGVGPAVAVTVFVLVAQQLEGNVIVPKVQGDLADLHPITVIFAIMASEEIWGPVGMLIAVPFAALLKLVIKEVYRYIIAPHGEEPDPRQLMLDELEEKEQ